MSASRATAVVPDDADLPLPGQEWGPADALAALEEARPALGRVLDGTHDGPIPAAVRVVSALTTVVLQAGPHAVKVYPPGTRAAHLARSAAALAGSATAHLPTAGPVVTATGVVTVSPWLDPAAPVTWPELGGLLRDFHRDHRHADVPRWSPLSRLASQVVGLPPAAARVLLRARDRLLADLDGVASDLGVGVIHGDVSLANALRSPDGPRLIDLDWVALAPLEYDLASSARRFRAGEISGETYEAFCTAYGADVLSWPGLDVLDRIADLGGVAFRLWDDRHRGRSLAWVADEVEVWRRRGA
jgi:Phosphotransferase enzyme family